MTKPLGQTVIVENRPSAGGILAPEQVKNAKPDGYTILIHHIGMATIPALYRQLRFNPLKDFEYIGLINEVPMTIVARQNFPAKDFKEFLAYIKANKDKVTLRERRHRRRVAPVRHAVHERDPERSLPHRAVQGHRPGDERPARRPGGFHVRPDHQHHLADQERQGQGLRGHLAEARAVAARHPDAGRAGLKGSDVGIWHGLYAPKGTPKPVLDKLVSALQTAMKDRTVNQRFAELGAVTVSPDRQNPQALERFLKSEIDKWGPIIRKAGQYAD